MTMANVTKKMVLVLMFLLLLFKTDAYAMTASEMVQELYANEKNNAIRKIEIAAMSTKDLNSVNGYKVLDVDGITKTVKYNLFGMGFHDSNPIPGTFNGKEVILFNNASNHDSEIDKIYNYVKGITKSEDFIKKSDVEKVNELHDIVVQTLEYDWSGANYKLYDVINTGKGTCVGYSTLFYLLAINSGIECQCVGNEEHMWNRVLIDNTWKYIDCTFNDGCQELVCYLVDEANLDEKHVLTYK